MLNEYIINNLLFTSGWPVLLVIMGLFIAGFFFKAFLFVAIPLFIFSIYFFRNPERSCPQALHNSSIFISPADGKIVGVDYSPTHEFDGYAQRVSIFLSPLDVHVNWTPCAGTLKAVNYRPGKFLVAYAPKASEVNERNDIVITCANGQDILVRQIAGLVARRIVWWVKPGQELAAGYKYGMIRFGSRVDLLLPENVTINVNIGDRVFGGQTALAQWK